MSKRERFAQWAHEQGYDISDDPGTDGAGTPETNDMSKWGFVDCKTDSLWQAWQACDRIAEQEKRELVRLLKRYRDETPLGHQPHMIADEVDALLAEHEAGST